MGREIGAGHYVSLRTIPGTDNWILYDDDVVSILDSEQVRSCYGSQDYRGCFLTHPVTLVRTLTTQNFISSILHPGHVDGYLLLYSRENDVFIEGRDPEKASNKVKSEAEFEGSDQDPD